MASDRYPGVPESQVRRVEDWQRRVAQSVNNTIRGRLNITGDVTLAANVATTTIALAEGQLAEESIILFDPTTSNAAAELYGATMWVSTRDVENKKVNITHANNAQTDRIFKYAILG